MSRFNEEKLRSLRKIDRIIRMIYLFPKNKRRYKPVIKTDVKEIFLMGIWLIGDTIMHLPIINILKKNYPNARITILCERQSEIILKSQGLVSNFVLIKCPWVVPMDHSLKSLLKFFFSARIVNRVKYDLAFEFRGDWRSIFYMNFVRSKRKISFNYSGGEYMLTDAIVPDPRIENITQESVYLLKQFGCTYEEADISPRLRLAAADEAYIANFRLENGIGNRFIIGIHPGSSQEVKRWEEKNYAELITKLSETYDNTLFILFEGPNERASVAAIENVLNERHIDHLVINKTLHEYVVLISLCEIMICNDSGAGHIAGAYTIPVVVIFGNRGPEFVFPYGSKQQEMISHELECKPCYQTYCKFGTIFCLTEITVAEVYNKTANIINSLLSQV